MQAAEAFVEETFSTLDGDVSGKVVSSWGPYTSIVGTAVKTGVAGLTAKAELTAKARQAGHHRAGPHPRRRGGVGTHRRSTERARAQRAWS